MTYIAVTVAARQTGLSPRTVRRYIRRGLVGAGLNESDLIELRRIRRLTDLGVNLAGVEIVLRMRRRIEDLQAETAHLQNLLEAALRDRKV
jgi:MerR family transcriptional regulator/heat shock protein HspR